MHYVENTSCKRDWGILLQYARKTAVLNSQLDPRPRTFPPTLAPSLEFAIEQRRNGEKANKSLAGDLYSPPLPLSLSLSEISAFPRDLTCFPL